jgi:sugar lactone lactonase YvrE
MEDLLMDRRQALTGIAAAAAATVLAGAERANAAPSAPTTTAHTGRGDLFPTLIQLPDNWLPEGIAIGRLPFAYFGSRADGSIYRANLVNGTGKVISQGPGTPSVGLKIDSRGRLFVAGGTGGDARVVNAFTGEVLASYRFTTADSFINDVVLTDSAAWFTNTRTAVLYEVPLGRHGRLPAADGFRALTLTGDIPVNAGNGIVETPDGRALLVVSAGQLFHVNKSTGATTLVDLAGESLTNGDGLLLRGRTLYAVQNRLNQVAVLNMSRDGKSGQVLTRVTDPRFDVPTTVAEFGDRLYLPNARFGAVPPATTFTAVAIPRPCT